MSTDLDAQLEKLRKGLLISESEVRVLCEKAREVLMMEGNVQHLDPPITRLFEVGGACPDTKYLFIGDFVDRGLHSVETLLLLLALKVKYPSRLFLVRGNHESRQITQVYGFYDECLRKFGSANIWRYCCDVFDYISLGALIGNSILCLHGGLSPAISSLDQIRIIDRKQEIPHEGPMCDLMWSDPEEIDGWKASPRGAGYLFGKDVVEKFLLVNDLSLIARAHQLVMEGYKKMFDDKVFTVWSAPNYCYRCNNVASILQISDDLSKNFVIFGAAPIDQRTLPFPRTIADYFL